MEAVTEFDPATYTALVVGDKIAVQAQAKELYESLQGYVVGQMTLFLQNFSDGELAKAEEHHEKAIFGLWKMEQIQWFNSASKDFLYEGQFAEEWATISDLRTNNDSWLQFREKMSLGNAQILLHTFRAAMMVSNEGTMMGPADIVRVTNLNPDFRRHVLWMFGSDETGVSSDVCACTAPVFSIGGYMDKMRCTDCGATFSHKEVLVSDHRRKEIASGNAAFNAAWIAWKVKHPEPQGVGGQGEATTDAAEVPADMVLPDEHFDESGTLVHGNPPRAVDRLHACKCPGLKDGTSSFCERHHCGVASAG